MSKKDDKKTEEPVRRGSRYLRETPRQYWVRTAIVTVGIFAVVLFTNYSSRGPTSALLWATGIAGGILAYFVISYFLFRR